MVHQSSTEQVNTVTDYLGGYQYVGGILQHFPTAEGYVSVTNGKDFDYVYNYTDHLGNIRVSYTMPKGSTVLSILEENHYYPFGMKHANYGDGRHDYVRNPDGTGYAVIDEVHRNKYQYRYNSKEFQDEFDLNWYDYGARNYDPAISRWMNIDPLAEKYYGINPYAYAGNNPILFIDPDGRHIDTSHIYAKNKDGEYKDPALVKAFNSFAQSKEGIAFLSNFASKGQTIAGHKYKEAGKFDKNDTDLKFGGETRGANGLTTHTLENGNLEVTLNVSGGTRVDKNIEDIAHEAFYHVEKYGEDYLNDRKLNSSNIDKDIVRDIDTWLDKSENRHYKGWRTNYLHHNQGIRDEIDEKRTLPILKQYFRSQGSKKSEEQIKKGMSRHM
ncbi:RHS repeat domain-containing protein [Flavobacterium soli]|uniref:RHS repeat domain-containing protein n=1 Tax=Flavobacterium soli TaxID=344881 RepID=UPI001FE1D411|nr:RHS repeat-associated core domain-containing protein [Flavobacterium soli]